MKKHSAKLHTVAFDDFTVECPATWCDISEEDEPETLADPEQGVGALQFSVAIYEGGELPIVSVDALRELTLSFAKSEKLGKPVAEATFHEGALSGFGASFKSKGDLFQAWYVSDGKNFIFATYICDWDERQEEAEIIQQVLRSVQFKPAGAAEETGEETSVP